MNHHEHLPIEDYDHHTVGTLQHAIRSLSHEDLQTLLRYEQEHANRPLVKELLGNRMDELAHGAEPSPGEPPAASPSAAQPRHEQQVEPGGQADRIIQPSRGVPRTGHKPREGPK
jgi:hypothetical protein